MLTAAPVQLWTGGLRMDVVPTVECGAALCFPAHEAITVNQKFQLAAMLLKIVWAHMKGIIKTENG